MGTTLVAELSPSERILLGKLLSALHPGYRERLATNLEAYRAAAATDGIRGERFDVVLGLACELAGEPVSVTTPRASGELRAAAARGPLPITPMPSSP